VPKVSTSTVVERLRQLDGVLYAFEIAPSIRDQLREIERQIRATLGIEVKNTGVEECLKRDQIICIIKDKRFRPPPEPTIYLVADDGTILGQEVLESDKPKFQCADHVIFLSDDFVVFADRRPKPGCKEYFLMPPVRFPEVEAIDGVRNVVSCSPSPLGDLLIRKAHNITDDPRLASVLIGFDIENDDK
jgi:hypothetical protein